MARSPRRPKKVYWDACTWIAQIANQKTPLPGGSIEDRGALCRAVVADAEKGTAEIFTSALCLAEVCKLPSDPPDASDKIKEFFENDFIIIVQLDRRTGELARDLMQAGYAGLKPPDAVHLASASISKVEEMHTFDGRLLALDGRVTKTDGTKLKICKPSMGGPPLPLLDSPEQESEAEEGTPTVDEPADEPSEKAPSSATSTPGAAAPATTPLDEAETDVTEELKHSIGVYPEGQQHINAQHQAEARELPNPPQTPDTVGGGGT